jgi:hypothetical protein
MAGGITAHGQNAKDVPIPDPADGYVIAGGGGGAGGGILISGSIVNITGTLKVHGGDGADSCYVEAQCPADDDAGAGGGGGTIKVFYDPTAGTSVVPTDAQVDYGGGAPGRQVRGNKPTAGSGGYFHSWPCTPVVSHNQCDASHFQFNMPTYDQNFVPGARLFYGVSLGLNGFNGKTATIQHTLDPIEDNGQQKFVLSYGDWHGAQFQTTQGSYYKACFKHRAGADFPGELSNSFVDLGTQNAGMFSVNLFSSSTQTEQKLRESIVALPGGWTNNSIAFQAPSTGQSYLTFRTGSFRQGWFTGSLDLDNVGVLPCASNDPTCQNVSCDAVSTSANLVGASGSTQSQDATFDSNNDPTSVWLHSSAAPNINDASTKAHLRDPDNNGYLQIQSKNYFEQSVTPCPSGAAHCYQWTGTVQLASADFQLYSIAVILAQNLCGGDFVHSGYANVDPNDANCSRSDSKTASLNMCPGQPPQADVIGPLTVCANQDATFSATVSHPDPSVDSHQYEWYTKQAGPNTPAPTINPEGYQLIGSDVGTVVAGTINSDQMQIPMNFILGVRVKSSSSTFPPVFSEKTVRVIRCSNEPSEDVHAGGRAIINPPPGTADTKKNVLKWLEIPAWLP